MTKPEQNYSAAEQQILTLFEDQIGRLPGDGDVAQARDQAIELFKQNGLPSRRLENWHYSDIRTLLRAVPVETGVKSAFAEKVAPFLPQSDVYRFENAALQNQNTNDSYQIRAIATCLQNGVAVSQTDRSDDLVGQLNNAFVSDGLQISIPQDTTVSQPIELQLLQGGGQGHLRFPITIGSKAKATIVERHKGQGDGSLESVITNLDMQAGSELTYIIIRDHDDNDTQLAQFNATLAEDAKLTLFIVHSGAALTRQEVNVDLEGENSDFQLRGINLLAGTTHTDVTMTVRHLVENTTSTEIMRNVVTDKARGVFQGMIRVAQQAQKTDARMACNSLILSDDAEFDAKPELEIFADDVACGHGATVAEIDHDHLFYLMARGIPENEARGLLIKAFVAQVVEDVDIDNLDDAVEQILTQWFARHL